MQQQQQSPGGFLENGRACVSWIAYISQVLEISVAVFLRRGFGRRYLGTQAALVVPLILLYSAFWEGHDVTPLFMFLGLYVCGWLANSKEKAGKDEMVHSRYTGTPELLRIRVFRGRLSEQTAKRVVEPLIVCLVGVCTLSHSEPLGTYLILAGIGTMISVGLTIAHEEKMLMETRDAYLAQQNIAERFRDRFQR